MRFRTTFVAAALLPQLGSSFTRPGVVWPLASSINKAVTHISSSTKFRRSLPENNSRWRYTQYTMASQGVDLSSGVWTGGSSLPPEAAPAATQSTSTSPAFDRSKLGFHINIGSKVFNIYGAFFTMQALFSALILFPFCFLAGLVSPIFDWKRMRSPTAIALLWGRLSMLAMGIRPKVEGTKLLPPKDEPVVFVANHGSYLDIPVTNFLPRLCKYLMKAELLWLPIVGWKAVLSRDIFVHRQTPATFRNLLKAATRSIKAGNSIMTFPEGTRSRDGRLKEFKRGPFTMAQRAGVRVVPISITGVAHAMPPFALAPLFKPREVRLRIHPPISTKGRAVKDVIVEARRAVSDGLEDWQKPSNLLSPPSPPPSTPPSPPPSTPPSPPPSTPLS